MRGETTGLIVINWDQKTNRLPTPDGAEYFAVLEAFDLQVVQQDYHPENQELNVGQHTRLPIHAVRLS